MTSLTGVVLVCDDNEDTLEYLEVLLRRAGHVVYTATGHGDLMPLINSVRPDLLLCDIYLPGRNGFQIAEQLRAQGEHIPIVFMTAFDTSLYRAYAQQVENAPYITKPFDGDKLLRQIESTLQTNVPEHAFVA